MPDLAAHAHRCSHVFRKGIYGERNIRTHIENFVASGRIIYRLSDYGCDIGDMSEGALLFPIAEDGHRFALEQLVHKNAYHVPIPITDVLLFAINVAWPKDDIIQSEHFVRNP